MATLNLPRPLRSGRVDQLLSRIEALAHRSPSEAGVRDELDRVRGEFVQELVQALGGPEAVLELSHKPAADFSKDARYVVSLFASRPDAAASTFGSRPDAAASTFGSRPDTAASTIASDLTLAWLLRRSVLGAFNTARALYELFEQDCVTTLASPAREEAAARPAALDEVVLGDASGSQAAIVRTLLRVSMKNVPPVRTVDSTDALRQACRERRARLLVADLALPGTLSLTNALRSIRAAGEKSPVVVIGSFAELEGAKQELPRDVALVPRPLDRASITAALSKLGLVSANV
jgi:CheY-like chemotaxis protein